MKPPLLDSRNAKVIYEQAEALAERYSQTWSGRWREDGVPNSFQDPGVAMLRLFADLTQFVTGQLNQVPEQRELAFMKFMGIQQRNPLPAIAPLCFKLMPQSKGVKIPAGATFADADAHQIVFRTERDLAVLPIKAMVSLFIDPFQDWFVDWTDRLQDGKQISLFSEAGQGQPLNHLAFIGDANLFVKDDVVTGMQLQLKGRNLSAQFFGQWFDGNGTPLAVEIQEYSGLNQLQVTLSDLPDAPKMPIKQSVNNVVGAYGGLTDWTRQEMEAGATPLYWLSTGPARGLKILNLDEPVLPRLDTLEVQLFGDGIVPDAVASNSVTKINDGCYPFGKQPESDAVFYLGHDDVFAREGAHIKILFNLRSVEIPESLGLNPQLIWEFWNGQKWSPLCGNAVTQNHYLFKDQTNALLHNNAVGETYISFLCPDIPTSKVAGLKSRWIRAGIASGSYSVPRQLNSSPMSDVLDGVLGEIAKKVAGDKTNPLYATFSDAKTVTALDSALVSGFATKGVGVGVKLKPAVSFAPFIISANIDFSQMAKPQRYVNFNSFQLANMKQMPYQPVPVKQPAFFMGFGPIDDGALKSGEEICLYFDLVETVPPPNNQLSNGLYEWAWFDGLSWQSLQLDDGTKDLTEAGIVRLKVPEGLVAATLFGQHYYWFRLTTTDPNRRPVVHGIYLNSVMAANALPIVNELLGSGTGAPLQTFVIDHTPILAGQQLITKELVYHSNSEHQTSEEIEVPWTEVANFLYSLPDDRHYVLNRETGVVIFGDGVHGRTLPVGINNVIAKSYSYGQGSAGNLPPNRITLQKPRLEGVAQVTNPAEARGGYGGDDNANVLKRGPHLVQAYGRAITREDFTSFAINADQLVVRATTLKDAIGNISIYVVCSGQPHTYIPRPENELLLKVARYVTVRAQATLAKRIQVLPAQFQPITVNVAVFAQGKPLTLRKEISDAIQGWLDPLLGGPDGDGWPFAALLDVLFLEQQLVKLDGISSVASLTFNHTNIVRLPTDSLPTPGPIAIVLYEDEVSLGD